MVPHGLHLDDEDDNWHPCFRSLSRLMGKSVWWRKQRGRWINYKQTRKHLMRPALHCALWRLWLVISFSQHGHIIKLYHTLSLPFFPHLIGAFISLPFALPCLWVFSIFIHNDERLKTDWIRGSPSYYVLEDSLVFEFEGRGSSCFKRSIN